MPLPVRPLSRISTPTRDAAPALSIKATPIQWLPQSRTPSCEPERHFHRDYDLEKRNAPNDTKATKASKRTRDQ